MVKNAIKVFARLKPEVNKMLTVNYQIHKRPKKHLDEDLLVISALQKSIEYIDNRPESWNFSFYQIFDNTIEQEDIFNSVALPVITSLFDGYNGTIFAYGQTGSGKTYTITGDSEKFDDYSGILPRTIHQIFKIIENNKNNSYTVELSYLEIYNENGYDLLDQKQRKVASRLEDLPRVEIHEDELNAMHLKNLGLHTVKNEQEAIDLLFIGDANRMTCETPMNPRSSRSHCIFTIILSSKKLNCNDYSRTKMHLVDLAGSERVYKCAITGTILTEAKYINLSLHYLEQVIVRLSQENASHVPYRNSLLTAILRDSLGGNCITNMLANLSLSAFNLEETISTCRFAQRVALIRNDVKLVLKKEVQTEMDIMKMENERLRKQIDELNLQLGDLRSTTKDLEYYKDLTIQRDRELSMLMGIVNMEKNRQQEITVDKMMQTELILSKVFGKCVVNIKPECCNEDGNNFSADDCRGNNYLTLRKLYEDTNFNLNSSDKLECDCAGIQEEYSIDKLMSAGINIYINKLIQEKSFIGNNMSKKLNWLKFNSGHQKKKIRTRGILRRFLGLKKKSPRPLSVPGNTEKNFMTHSDKKIQTDNENEVNDSESSIENGKLISKYYLMDENSHNDNINFFN